MIKRFFSRDEMVILLMSNFYSILYYNSEIWHLPSLKPELKQLRQTLFKITKTNRYKIVNNILTSRLTTINNKIDLNDLNLSLNSFKVKFKKVLLFHRVYLFVKCNVYCFYQLSNIKLHGNP